MSRPVEQVLAELRKSFPQTWTAAGCGPARVNLIGEHIDYNGGLVMPLALPLATVVVMNPREDGRYRLHSTGMPLMYEGPLPTEPLTDRETKWANYPLGVIALAKQAGMPINGIDACFDSTVPLGASLSSSAAIEVAMLMALCAQFDWEMSRIDRALLCQKAEHEWAKVPCGIMDQTVSIAGCKGRVMLLDCATRTWEEIPWALKNAVLLVWHCGERHGLDEGTYRRRLEECQQALRTVNSVSERKFPNLCAVPEDLISSALPMDTFGKRARHAVGEQRRVKQAQEALRLGDERTLGELMNESHQSLSELYQVSCPALDRQTGWMRQQRGVFGARMTGAGMGGCAIGLVEPQYARRIMQELAERFFSESDSEPIMFLAEPSDGAFGCKLA